MRAVLLAIMLVSSACGYLTGDEGVFRDRSEDYKKAPDLPALSVPPGVSSVPIRDIYPIPEVDDIYLEPGEFAVPRPVPLAAGAGQELVRIQKLGDERWILIGLAPGQLWPQVRNFISASGMQVARADARGGLMETNWLTVQGEPLPSRFRFRMEQGVQRGTSELHILQMDQSNWDGGWPSKSDDLQLEAQLIQSVAQYLADSADSAPVSLVAEQGMSAGGKIALRESEQGDSFLRLELPYDRAWASLGRALEKSYFDIADRDRSSGIYYVRFLGRDGEDEPGWWSKLWQSDDAPPSDRVYLVSVTALPEQAVRIDLTPQDRGAFLDDRDRQEMLTAIKGNIN
ncbi:MAG: outer membrane protein assembly factor BamC [Halioglobus sp.]|nr:outer membrane protein assembly factor BamC [Halioglobus sp.]